MRIFGSYWGRRQFEPSPLLLIVKTVIVVIALLVLWALRDKDMAVVYMRF